MSYKEKVLFRTCLNRIVSELTPRHQKINKTITYLTVDADSLKVVDILVGLDGPREVLVQSHFKRSCELDPLGPCFLDFEVGIEEPARLGEFCFATLLSMVLRKKRLGILICFPAELREG